MIMEAVFEFSVVLSQKRVPITKMYQDDPGKWFCPDCVVEEINPSFLDEGLEHPGAVEATLCPSSDLDSPPEIAWASLYSRLFGTSKYGN